MRNCIVAQSGGPTAVINATVAGIVKANQMHPYYDVVYGGLNGIEGTLQGKLVDLTEMSDEENLFLRQTPSSALGSCRYKLKRDNEADFKKLLEVMEKYEVETMFYIGGNDSMDTVAALSEYCKEKGITNRRFIGCPKTVDNDLMYTDHTPGFPSAAKFIATAALHTWLDLNVYTRQEVFILETMGRDAGWLAASACLSKYVDLVVLPEVVFDKELFLKEVRRCVAEKNKCYIVVSEGIKYADGTYVAASAAKNDGFGHAMLGGAGNAVKNIILEAGVSERAKVQDLATIQRCAAGEQSLVDVNESFQLGMSAHMRSTDGKLTGYMVGLVRKNIPNKYDVDFVVIEANKVANQVKPFPAEWIKINYRGITEEAVKYMEPLIEGTNPLQYKDGIPQFVKPYYMK